MFVTRNSAQTIDLGGLVVDVNEIPINGQLYLGATNNGSKGAGIVTSQILFKSEDGRFFAKTSYDNISKHDLLETKSDWNLKNILEVYDSSGKLQFKKELEHPIMKCSFDKEGKYCYLITTSFPTEETDSYSNLIILKEGEILIEEKYVNHFFDRDKCIFYNNNDEENKYLFYKNFATGQNWKVPIDYHSHAIAISQEGNNVIVYSKDYPRLQSYDSSGKLLWFNPELKEGVSNSLSKNGKYLLRTNKANVFSVYDNLTGNYLSSIFPLQFEGETIYPTFGCFIDNTEDRILIVARYDGVPKKCIFCEFDIKGELINNILVNTSYHNIFRAILNADGSISIFFNGIEEVKLSNEFKNIYQ